MIKKGDLVKLRLRVGSDATEGALTELFVLGEVMNYCEDEDTYIVAPRVISVPKGQVLEIEALPQDFDFAEVSMELQTSKEGRKPESPPKINKIRFSKER